MARLYADENFPFPVVEELRRLGNDPLILLGKPGSGKTMTLQFFALKLANPEIDKVPFM
jgi:predicted NACHT family NTPase